MTICCAKARFRSTLGYRGFTKSCCTRSNHVVCHGIPGDKVLKDGDMSTSTSPALLNGWARRYQPHVPRRRRALEGEEAGRYDLRMPDAGGETGQPATAWATSRMPSSATRGNRYGVVPTLSAATGSPAFHDSPEVVHAGRPGTGPELKPGMFFTISDDQHWQSRREDADDGWTAAPATHIAAQFEHSIGITETRCEIFTKSPAGRIGRLTSRHDPPELSWHCARSS